MTREQNLATQQRLVEIVNAGELDRLDEVFAADVVDHDPAPDQGPGVDGFRDFFTSLSTAFPDAQLHVDTSVADEDQVAIAYRLTGTHKGDFLGIKKTGKSIQMRGVQIARFRNAKIVERWGSTDELGILQQIEADEVPEPPGEGGSMAKKLVAGAAVAAAGVAAASAIKGSSEGDEEVTTAPVVPQVAQTQQPPVTPITAPTHKDSMPVDGRDDGAQL